jgi:hypothetical protein
MGWNAAQRREQVKIAQSAVNTVRSAVKLPCTVKGNPGAARSAAVELHPPLPHLGGLFIARSSWFLVPLPSLTMHLICQIKKIETPDLCAVKHLKGQAPMLSTLHIKARGWIKFHIKIAKK